jgi:hypothetical protein
MEGMDGQLSAGTEPARVGAEAGGNRQHAGASMPLQDPTRQTHQTH